MNTQRGNDSQGGFTLLEIIVALIIGVIAIGIPVVILAAGGHGFARQASKMAGSTQLLHVTEALRASAHTSVAIFTPSSCGTAAHGDGQGCNEVRFYGKDAQGGVHIWGWEFANGNLRECLAYASPDGGCTQYGNALEALAFDATPTKASALATAAQIGATPTDKEIEMESSSSDPNGRIVAGNRVMIVDVATAFGQRSIHLLQGGAPFSLAVLRGTFIPPSLSTLFANGSTDLVFASPNAPTQSVSLTESNYSQYEPYLSPPYWTPEIDTSTSCLSGSGAPIASITAPSDATNVNGPRDTTAYTITPAAVGNCAFDVSTHDQTLTIHVTVLLPPTPQPTPTPTPTDSPTPAPTATPASMPTGVPTPIPTGTPTASPTDTPSPVPTGAPTATPSPYMTCVDGGGSVVPATRGFFYTVPNPSNGNRCTMVLLFTDNTSGTGQFAFPEPNPGYTSTSERVVTDLYPKRSACFGMSGAVSGQNGPNDGQTTCTMYWQQPPGPYGGYRTTWTILRSSGTSGASGSDYNGQTNVSPTDGEANAYVSLLAAGATTWTNPCAPYGYFTSTPMFFFAFPGPQAAAATYGGFPPDGTPTIAIKLVLPYATPCIGGP